MENLIVEEGAVICPVCGRPLYMVEQKWSFYAGEPVHNDCYRALREHMKVEIPKDIDDIIA